MKAPSPAARIPAERTPASFGREGRVTAITLLKNYYDEEIFNLLVKPMYDADLAVSEAAIRASGSPGNEVARDHLFKIIESGKKSQRLAAIQSLTDIRAPTSVGMLIKYFNHFSSEDDVRTAILGALNAIAPTSPQVQELDQAVLVDARQSEEARKIAVEALVDAEKDAVLLEALPRTPNAVQEAAFYRMLRRGRQAVPNFTNADLKPGPLGAYLCLYLLMAESKEQAQKQAQKQVQRTMPRLTYQSNWVLPRTNHKLGSAHATDLLYTFDNIYPDGQWPPQGNATMYQMEGTGPGRFAVANYMSEMFATFARTSRPGAKGAPAWPAYTAATRTTMFIDEKCTVVNDPFGEERRLWASLQA